MNASSARPAPAFLWPAEGRRLPYAVFTDPAVYAPEQKRIFHGANSIRGFCQGFRDLMNT